MPPPPINRPDPGNMGFLRALLAAIIFMIFSAAILVSGFLAWHYPQFLAGSNIKPITLTGNELYIAIGKGEKQGSNLIVNELIEDGTAVISSRRARFNASNYPILEYKITGRNPGSDVVLYWRTITHNQQTLFAKLHWNSDYKSAFNLQNHPEWKGKVTELGISIAGDLRNEPISIQQLTFSPLTVESLLLTVWSEWNAFEGWTQASINVIKGMPSNALISPVVAAAAWCGLAILMYSLRIVRTSVVQRDTLLSVDRDHPGNSTWKLAKGIWDFRAVVAMFLIAWLALDGKWQVNLWHQLGDTKYLFAGKKSEEKHLTPLDSELYEFAQHIKQHLPDPPQRIFLATPIYEEYRYHRLRSIYHLLPHNVYSYGTMHKNMPAAQVIGQAKTGDYILLLSNSAELVDYNSATKTIRYNLLYNGSFEGGRDVLQYCQSCSYGNYRITNEVSHSGRFSLEQIGPPQSEYEIRIPGGYFWPGGDFDYSLWTQLTPDYEGHTDTLHGRIFYDSRKPVTWSGHPNPNDTDWQRLSHTFSVDKTSKVSQVSLYVGYPTGIGTRYIDDIELITERPAKLIFQSDTGALYQILESQYKGDD